MQVLPPDSEISDENGFLQRSLHLINTILQKPFLWVVLVVFIFSVSSGYSIGKNIVVQSANQSDTPSPRIISNTERVITLFEVSDLSVKEPELLSIWFIYIRPGDQPRLGFTPVAAISMPDDSNIKLLENFSMDENNHPSQDFLRSVNTLKVKSSGYILLDQVSIAALINWLSGKKLGDPIDLQNHSMPEYGQILRGMCNSLPQISEKGIPEFSWSMYSPEHIITTLQFDQVISNIKFITSSQSPQCEMVPLP